MLAPALLLLLAVAFSGLLLIRNRNARFVGTVGVLLCLCLGALLFLVGIYEHGPTPFGHSATP